MADSKISDLTELTSPDNDDEFVIVDKSDTTMAATGTNKKMTLETLKENIGGSGAVNILANGNFINNSTNGYGGTSDDWTNSSANPVQGGIPAFTKQNLIDWLGISDGDIEGLWNLNEASGNATDLSSNGYTLTDNNTVGSSDDGLMAKARDFEAGNSEYLTGAAANAKLTGAQTYFAFIKPESMMGTVIMGFRDSDASDYKNLFVHTDGTVRWQLEGLTPDFMASEIKLEAGKWYFICFAYNGSNLVNLWVNGIKKATAVTGSISAGTSNNMSIGRGGDNNGDYFDGLIQNAGVLSVALTDDQVKRLWWETLGKKTKLRRATTDGYIEQELPQFLIEQYKGKTLSITGKVWQDTASIAQVSLVDDDGETESTANATTGEYIKIGTTRTIASDTTTIKARAKVSDSDGNAWFKEIQVYEGSSLVYEWNPSKNDWSRFPRLLKGDIPAVISGYQFEEGRVYSWIPNGTGYSAGASIFSFTGKQAFLAVQSASEMTDSSTNLPIKAKNIMPTAELVCDPRTARFYIAQNTNILGKVNNAYGCNGVYEID